MTHLDRARSNEGDKDGDDVDGQLELQELRNAVVDVATPHDRLDDARKVVVSQHNVRRFLRHVSARNTLDHQRRTDQCPSDRLQQVSSACCNKYS